MLEKTLFDHVRIGNLDLKNRMIRSATWEGLVESDGKMPEERCSPKFGQV